MRAWLMALITAGARILKTAGPHTANTTFIVPVNTSKIETLSGKGGAGTPASSGSYFAWRMHKYRYTQIYYTDGSSEALDYPGSRVGISPSSAGASPPAPYCDSKTDASGYPAGTQKAYCYHYENSYDEIFSSSPATTGASTTAFGKTFPGGVGGPASVVTYTDIPVTSGKAENFAIPSGGSVSFTYYE